MFVGLALFAHAQTSDGQTSTSGITFPVQELGNCTSKEECRTYCNDTVNMSACVDFAKKHGLMNADEADRAGKFAKQLRDANGPGGCTTPESCETFCKNIANLETCVSFAEKQGFKNKNAGEGRKMLDYIKAGGKTPGGCDSKESCETYCKDFSHAEECFNFAKRAGLAQAQSGEGKIPEGQFQKFLMAVKNNETPGGCKSKDECEAYCRVESKRDECLAFGKKIGFVNDEEVRKFKELGGKGPGGCASQDACRNYCNDQTHHDECYKFAEDNDLVSRDQLDKAKQGFLQLRVGLENAPPEVAECMKSVLGENVLNDIQSGKFTPGTEIGERVRSCFDKFGKKQDAGDILRKAPALVQVCLKEKLGDDFSKIQANTASPTSEVADTFRVCAQKVQIERAVPLGGEAKPANIGGFLRSAPPEIQSCLKERLGSDFETLQNETSMMTPEIKMRMQECFQSFKPQPADKGIELNDAWTPPGGIKMIPPTNSMPPQFAECVKMVGGEEVYNNLQKGIKPEGDILQKIYSCASSRMAPQPSTPLPIPDRKMDDAVQPPTEGCISTETCRKYCYDSSSKYYSTSPCEVFRKYSTSAVPPTTNTPVIELLHACPEHWYVNNMPSVYSAETMPREYFVFKGVRHELSEFDMGWVKTNCPLKQELVF